MTSVCTTTCSKSYFILVTISISLITNESDCDRHYLYSTRSPLLGQCNFPLDAARLAANGSHLRSSLDKYTWPMGVTSPEKAWQTTAKDRLIKKYKSPVPFLQVRQICGAIQAPEFPHGIRLKPQLCLASSPALSCFSHFLIGFSLEYFLAEKSLSQVPGECKLRQ